MRPLTRAELLALPPATNVTTLGRAFGISEPVARERQRRGDFAAMGIRIVRLGAQYRVVTADILRVLGIDPETQAAGPAPSGPAADTGPSPAKEQSRAYPTLPE
jgi:hypothetical protein